MIEICRGDEECADKTATAAGSLLTGSRLTDWMHSPTGRMSMKPEGRNANGHDEELRGMIDGI